MLKIRQWCWRGRMKRKTRGRWSPWSLGMCVSWESRDSTQTNKTCCGDWAGHCGQLPYSSCSGGWAGRIAADSRSAWSRHWAPGQLNYMQRSRLQNSCSSSSNNNNKTTTRSPQVLTDPDPIFPLDSNYFKYKCLNTIRHAYWPKSICYWVQPSSLWRYKHAPFERITKEYEQQKPNMHI